MDKHRAGNVMIQAISPHCFEWVEVEYVFLCGRCLLDLIGCVLASVETTCMFLKACLVTSFPEENDYTGTRHTKAVSTFVHID